MKKLIALLTILLIAGNAYAADLVFEIVIKDDANKQMIINGIKRIAPIPDNDQDGNPDFTDEDWVKEFTERMLIQFAQRGDQAIRKEAVQARSFDGSVEQREPGLQLP